MISRETAIAESLALETDKAAVEAFARLVGADESRRARFATQIADSLGNQGEFHQYVSGPAGERLARIDRLLRVFRENVELLVHKTWVEKAEERPKARLLEDLAAFEREFRDGAVSSSFKLFVALANSLASLLFGHQSRAEDFVAYCFRIDPKFGLFFWFVSELEKQARDGGRPDELLTLETLLGIYALSSF